MAEIEVREFLPDDIESFHALHDAVFPPVPLEEMVRWMQRPDVTAGVAVRGGEVVGEIPLHVREFVIRPGVTARLAFEHSVCVHEQMRGVGVGSAIQDEIKRFMRGRADVLSVYRGGERTPAYRHYWKNGLTDLCYLRRWTLADPAAVAKRATEVLPAEAILGREREFLAVFADAFGDAGGYQRRAPGFYATALTQLEAVEMGTAYSALVVEDAGNLLGYCIIGAYDGTATVMELATRAVDLEMAAELVRAACQVAAESGARVAVELHDGGRYRPVFEQLGFAPRPRGDMIMATPLDWEALAAIVWVPQPELAEVQVELWTPDEEATIHRPAGMPARTITVECKHEQAVRWLLSRLDLPAECARERLTCCSTRPGDVEALGRAIPFAPWEYQGIDHI
ncbi:MAG: N-acetyltransferase family protein [Armatimonadota bacterium]